MRRRWIGKDFSSLETTLKTQLVSFRIVICFSTFQTHIKVLQLYFRLQDRFYTHHWFVTFLNLFTVQNVCLYVCTEQSCYFILFLFWMLQYIYKEILQVWYFMVSTTVHFLYPQILLKNKENNKK